MSVFLKKIINTYKKCLHSGIDSIYYRTISLWKILRDSILLQLSMVTSVVSYNSILIISHCIKEINTTVFVQL